jgi:predicted CXXCH cytochrome family protein
MSRQRKKFGRQAQSLALYVGGGGIVVALAVSLLLRRGQPAAVAARNPPAPPATTEKADADLFATYGKSPSCKSCHEEAFQLWSGSHHALAERPVDPAQDTAAFEPPYRIHHGSQISETRMVSGKPELLTTGIDGQRKAFRPERVLGFEPLRQFLIPAAGGRLQASELAYDPRHPDWFDVYGEEDRRGGEWGHWTGRGMTWNGMCAGCHNTRVRKNYLPESDAYATRMAEMAVGCEACHGPMADHNAWQAAHPKQSDDPTVRRIKREEMFSACASCHARRADLTSDFRPGESFFDHYSLNIPDETELFYPDGQIRDEDFEFTAFMGSRMRAAGVRCIDCHEPHSGKIRMPGNNLCLICHAAPAPPAPKIDPLAHSHHRAGERGDNCVDCHMPQTVYMQRHARHDHGFTIPDPLLTKQLGIPNACTGCHADQSLDWSLQAVEKWYGARMQRPSRVRAQIMARARSGSSASPEELTGLLHTETNAFWRAVSANLLRRWANEPPVTSALLAGISDPDPLVRLMSLRALEPMAQSANKPVEEGLRRGLDDRVRSVRIEAAWALHASIDTNSPAGLDLLNYLRYNADQPSGVLQQGVFNLDREDLNAAMSCFRRAISWDPNSAPLHHALAVGLSLQGRTTEAVEALQNGCRLAPQDGEYRFKLGLALNEAGKLEEACAALETAVKLDPHLSQAWYNLGLALNTAGKTDQALESLVRAESIDRSSPQIPYARAIILARLGNVAAARTAAGRALELEPGYTQAAELLKTLAQP